MYVYRKYFIVTGIKYHISDLFQWSLYMQHAYILAEGLGWVGMEKGDVGGGFFTALCAEYDCFSIKNK